MITLYRSQGACSLAAHAALQRVHEADGTAFECINVPLAMWRGERFSDDPQPHAALKAYGPTSVGKAFDLLETRLQNGLLGGEHFSAADAYVLPFWRWAWRIGLPLDRWPRYRALIARIVEVDAVKRAIAAEALEMPS